VRGGELPPGPGRNVQQSGPKNILLAACDCVRVKCDCVRVKAVGTERGSVA
jgi:hypothetical protein